MMRLLTTIFYLILIILGVSFAALNAGSIEVSLYFTKLTMPLSILLALMLGIGILIGFLLFLYRYWRLKIDYRKLKNQLKLTESEIKNLRSIPLKD